MPALPSKGLETCDVAPLAAILVMAVVGTWNSGLLVNDSAYLVSAGWLGDVWDLYFNQLAERSVSTMVSFEPAWLARWASNGSSGRVAH